MTCQGRTDFPRFVDVSGLNTHLAAEWVDDSRAIRANETRFRLALERVHDLRQQTIRRATPSAKTVHTLISSC